MDEVNEKENGSFLKAPTRQVTIVDDAPHTIEEQPFIENAVHGVFAEMLVYKAHSDHWDEASRWVKYEETVEAGSGRWSKPYVATTSLISLLQLSACLLDGQVLLNTLHDDMQSIVEQVVDLWIKDEKLTEGYRDECIRLLTLPKQHQHEQALRFWTQKRALSTEKLEEILKAHLKGEKTQYFDDFQQNKRLGKKLPVGCVAANILVGNSDFLEEQLFAFVRLNEPIVVPELTEVDIPTMFVVFLLGPEGHDYKCIARAVGAVLADEMFQDVSQNCDSKTELIAGLDSFLDETTVLPPSSWDPEVRLKPLAERSSRKKAREEEQQHWEQHGSHANDPALFYTGKPFGGLIADIKRKLPWYVSDFKDGLNLKAVSSFFFMYFAILSPIITFGGLYEEATDQRLAVIENILSACFCGVTYHLFCGQPLNIIGATGPVLVCETLIFDLCGSFGIDYLTFRLWICFWIFIFNLIIVATDFSVIIKYITRFTEESFATLIAMIFIVSSINKLQHIYENDKQYSLYDPHGYQVPQDAKLLHTASNDPEKDVIKLGKWIESTKNLTCYCRPHDDSSITWFNQIAHRRHWSNLWLESQPWYWEETDTVHNETIIHIDYSLVPPDSCHLLHGDIIGDACFAVHNRFFMSLVLTLGTFTIAMFLKKLKDTSFFPVKIRSTISDFAITLAVTAMVTVDWTLDIATDKLYVPTEIRPTFEGRKSFMVDPFINEIWTIFFAIVPGLFMTILIFMDQQITSVIVNRAENKFKKGAGYHLDMMVLSLQILVCGFLGLPIFVAATVLAMNHVNSLKIDSESRLPGEAPMFKGCLEQRVTGILTFGCIGLTVFLAPVLKHIPLAVLYGVFLYMGVNALNGLQLFDRILLMFIPAKSQPDYAYLRHVKIARVHLFTIIQLAMFALLLMIKSTKAIALAFPLMLVVIVIVRYLLNFVFTKSELSQLDDELPELFVRRKQDKQKKQQESKQRATSVSSLVRSGKAPTGDKTRKLSGGSRRRQAPDADGQAPDINQQMDTPLPSDFARSEKMRKTSSKVLNSEQLVNEETLAAAERLQRQRDNGDCAVPGTPPPANHYGSTKKFN